MEGREMRERRSFPRAVGHEPLKPRTRTIARLMFHGHLWLGIITTGIVLILGISGILLNHKRPLGLMPDVPHEPTGDFAAALPLDALAHAASAAAPAAAVAGVDRMDVRPRDGITKVRFRDDVVTEVTLDINDGTVLHVGQRSDVFLEKLHSGEIFGDNWILLSDLGAVALMILVVSGYWLWLFPRSRR
ncbi:MAG TPA: PepSY-associated TM helix domain-containing protein [Longimicrobiales bacterium]